MSGVRILYVEDEPFLGRIVKETLERRNFVVRMVDNGAEAVPVFDEWKPDICVLDIMLPQRDGYAIATELRAKAPALPIIFVTAKTQTEDVVKGFESGGNDYLRKPFSMEELIVRINNLLSITRKETTGKNVEGIALGKYTFYPNRYELKNGDQVRKLSHREAVLLSLLADQKNTVVQRKDILLKVWGDDSFFNSRNLDVYITRLREYLKEDADVEIITIKGVGYRFVAG
ncbi:MAG: response regulator transcription factor [Bacteroidetes bacterium]|nr:response regulator transcription factor [Bacteroidota bacterium]MBS1975941.1 response regulator transcription factor [Bacteroidota bacterium]